MPIYEYRCPDCGLQQEFLLKASDPPLEVCPACGKRNFTKLLSAAGFQLKGSGWYATDFKGKGSRPADKPSEAKPESSGGEAKADAKPETKPAATSAN